MKTLVTLFLSLLLSTFCVSQEIYWTVYNMEVDPGDENIVLTALDDFFNSPTGKTMPFVQINSKMFSNSEEDYTLQIIFSSEEKSMFGKMYSGELNINNDFRIVMSALDKHSKNKGSYLGKSINFAPDSDANFSQLISLSVTDPVTFLREFNTMKNVVLSELGTKVSLNLHRFISGAEPGVTHIAVFSATDFATLLDANDKIYAIPAFQNFVNKVKDIRTIVSTNTVVSVARYNMPNTTAAQK